MLRKQKGAMWLGVLFGLVIGLAFAVGVAWYLMQSTPKVFKNGDTTARKYDESDRKSNDNSKNNQASKTTGAVIKPVRPQQMTNKASNANGTNVTESSPVKTKPVQIAEKPQSQSLSTPTKTNVAADKPANRPKDTSTVAEQDRINKPKTEADKTPEPGMPATQKSNTKPVSQVAQLSQAKSDEKKSESAASAPVATKAHFFLQLGAFKNKQDAQKLLDRLKHAGIADAQVLDAGKDGLVRVKAGPYDSKDTARQTKGKLALAGFESIYSR